MLPDLQQRFAAVFGFLGKSVIVLNLGQFHFCKDNGNDEYQHAQHGVGNSYIAAFAAKEKLADGKSGEE